MMHALPVTLASTMGNPVWGCVFFAALPVVGSAWAFVLLRSFSQARALPIYLAVPVVLFAVIPAAITYDWLTATGKSSALNSLLGWFSVIGLLLFVLALGVDLFKRAQTLSKRKTGSSDGE